MVTFVSTIIRHQPHGGFMPDSLRLTKITPHLIQSLSDLARHRRMPVEAMASELLVRAFAEPGRRRREVGARLCALLDQISRATRSSLESSHVAIAIGEARAEHVDDWFAARLEPSFEQLAAIAAYLGAEQRWLLHGDGEPFPSQDTRLSEDAEKAVKWLVEGDSDLTHLHFVRGACEGGPLAIVKQFGRWRCITYRTPYSVSQDVGSGGEASLAHLVVMWQLLYAHYTKSRNCPVTIKSHVMPSEAFSAMGAGSLHPLEALRLAKDRPWWEDIWDTKVRRSTHWEDWDALCDWIQGVVDRHHSLAGQAAAIRLGQHPFLKPTPSHV